MKQLLTRSQYEAMGSPGGPIERLEGPPRFLTPIMWLLGYEVGVLAEEDD